MTRTDGTTRDVEMAYLTTDHETGEDVGHLRVPCSRYGSNTAECAPIAHMISRGVREIAAEWHGGQGSALYAFASTGTVTDGLEREVRQCIGETTTDRRELVELLAYVKDDVQGDHFHIGHNIAGYLPTADVVCVTDADDALSTYVEMVRDYADADDNYSQAALDEMMEAYPEDYSEDAGDDVPAMRATVDAILAENPPVKGETYGMTVVDGQGYMVSLWLTVAPADDCDVEDDES